MQFGLLEIRIPVHGLKNCWWAQLQFITGWFWMLFFCRIPYLRTERILTKKTQKEEKSKISLVFEERAKILPSPFKGKNFRPSHPCMIKTWQCALNPCWSTSVCWQTECFMLGILFIIIIAVFSLCVFRTLIYYYEGMRERERMCVCKCVCAVCQCVSACVGMCLVSVCA